MTVNRRVALGLLAGGFSVAASPGKARDPIAGWTVINALGSLDDPNDPSDFGGPEASRITPRILVDARASGQSAVNITIGFVAGEHDPYSFSKAAVAHWDGLIARHSHQLVKVLTAADIEQARRSDRTGLIYGFQNCAMLGEDLARIDEFVDAGVRVFQLTYNPANRLGGGSMAPETTPLTDYGRAVIARLEARRAMVDLSHSGLQTCLDAVAAAKRPISINHTACRALVDLPRNKTDGELRAVAQKGGFVGIYFMPFLTLGGHATAAHLVAHIEHALNICGEDHVGIGTDGGTTPIDDLAAYAAVLRAEHEGRKALGIAAPGEGAETRPFITDLRGPDQFRKLARLLAQRGHPSRRIEKILGRNFLDFSRTIWG